MFDNVYQNKTSVITLTLLQPGKNVPLQNWTFDTESVIRIGRSMDNDVVLYSAVVSRRHIEIRRDGRKWEVVSLGANGTYVDGKPITTVSAVDGMIIRLASSGPQIQIRLSSDEIESKLNANGDRQVVEKKVVPTEIKKTSKETKKR
ncbi:MAG: FHA domain-containing protein [Hydrococcus sp. Prado102]|jgi:pSer/pThr/pTyr-binding forkhead associated (FHA) protein|nr:FHA domain-containing protein [Hydrococcus sp. Prado102]